MIANAAPLIRWLLAGVFLYAGASKALNPAAFATAIQHFQLLPRTAVNGVALYLPWLEIVCALGLLHTKMRTGALMLVSALTIIFALAVGSALARRLDIECGCFGTASGSLPLAFFRLLLLAGVSGWLGWRESRLVPWTESRAGFSAARR